MKKATRQNQIENYIMAQYFGLHVKSQYGGWKIFMQNDSLDIPECFVPLAQYSCESACDLRVAMALQLNELTRFLDDLLPDGETLKNKKDNAFHAYQNALNAWKKEAQICFLLKVKAECFNHGRDDIHEAICDFYAVAAYPQKDYFEYDGYKSFCDSIVFVNEDGLEKAIILDRSDCFSEDCISIKNCGAVLLGEFGDKNDEGFAFLLDITYPDDLNETVRVPNKAAAKVLIEVKGGIAEVTQCPDWIETEILDHDIS